jgi:mRNA interferase MazF
VICDRYELAVVPFPFAEQADIKRRPVVAISGRLFNQRNTATVFAMVTTASGTRWPSDHSVIDLKLAGLNRPCVIRWRLVTLPNGLILKRLGTLSSADRLECERLLAEMFV